MTRRGWLPAWLGAVHPRLRTPIPATLCGGGVVFVLTVAVPFLHLVALTSTITLLVFALVNLALWRLQRQRPRIAGFRVPRFVPPVAALANVALAVAQFIH
jgi:amino acid transporter